MDILQRITQLKRQRNWNDYRLSVESGIPQTTISSWYKKNILPTLSSLQKICDAFGVSMAQFFTESEKFPDLTHAQKELLKNWGDLSRANRDLVLLIIDWMKRNLK